MKLLIPLASAAVLAATATFAFAQNSPGLPGGILTDEFHLNPHPQMQFAASAPSEKYQSDKKSALRKKGDMGDPDGCNLKCPMDSQ